MADINIRDLSIGDWVKILVGGKQRYVKVEQIVWSSMLNRWVVECNEGRFRLTICAIHPIPLTAEILEKNGLEYEDDGNDAVIFLCCDMFWARYCVGDTFWKVGIHSQDRLDAVICDVQTVHQLQNALRLAGVGKDIEV